VTRRARAALAVVVALGAAIVGACALFVAWPLSDELVARRPSSSLRVLDRAGGLLREVSAEGRSVPLENDEVPPVVRAAFVAAEDRRFDEHIGVDVRAIARALKDSIAAGEIVSGASTIPQQLARRLVPRERTVAGKVKEALWALRLSAHLTKERILVEYLNRVPLGNGTVGVEAASRFYFGKPARLLSPGEAALLAGMAHAPAREDPFRHPERARARRDVILGRMRAAGFLDDATAQRALDERLELAPGDRELRAPHFSLALVSSLRDRGLADAVQVETTIDPALQARVERIVADELAGPLAKAGVGQAAVVVLDNATGEVLAYVGSRGFFDAEHQGMNDGVRARRQPGSALKPFVYGLGLARGMTPATLLPDVELTMATETGTYAPRNYDKRVHGPVRLRAALQNSYNIPAVHVAEVLTPARVLDTLHGAGFASLDDDPDHYGVGVVLGNGDVTLLEMANAYRGLANGGVWRPVVDVRDARDGWGRALAVTSTEKPRRFLSKGAVALLTDILVDEESRAPAFGLDNALDFPFPVAAKTGTSRAYVDNWTAGFTAERTVAVWAGNFDGTPMKHVAGITGAGSIFRRVMRAAMEGVEHPAPLTNARAFETARICPLSGALAGPSCPGAFDEHFLDGTAPHERCDMHRGKAGGETALALPPRYASWARAEGLPLVDDASRPGRPRLLSPTDGAEFAVEPGVPEGQGIPLRIAAGGHDVVLVRGDDGTRLSLRAPFSTWLEARPGTRRIALYLPGESEPVDEAVFVVR
jgi:penicillin-binding protein 1C